MADKRLQKSDLEVKKINSDLSKRHNLAGLITLVIILLMLVLAD